MFWFLLWTGLIIAWLVAVVISMIWLWRHRAKPLIKAVETAGQAFERLGQTGQFHASQPAPVAVDATPQQRADIRQNLQDRRAARRARRRAAHKATWRQWAQLAGWRGSSQ